MDISSGKNKQAGMKAFWVPLRFVHLNPACLPADQFEVYGHSLLALTSDHNSNDFVPLANRASVLTVPSLPPALYYELALKP